MATAELSQGMLHSLSCIGLPDITLKYVAASVSCMLVQETDGSRTFQCDGVQKVHLLQDAAIYF